jgi:hypothetical protein
MASQVCSSTCLALCRSHRAVAALEPRIYRPQRRASCRYILKDQARQTSRRTGGHYASQAQCTICGCPGCITSLMLATFPTNSLKWAASDRKRRIGVDGFNACLSFGRRLRTSTRRSLMLRSFVRRQLMPESRISAALPCRGPKARAIRPTRSPSNPNTIPKRAFIDLSRNPWFPGDQAARSNHCRPHWLRASR